LRYAQSNLTVDSFNISNENQSISINGMAGGTKFENLNVDIVNFNLAEINPVIFKMEIRNSWNYKWKSNFKRLTRAANG
jgi:hypothetical protein